jgi:hypothetical protein
MNTTSLNGFSPNYIKSMLADQLSTGSLNNSSTKNAKTSQTSPFSQMLSDAASGNQAATTSNSSQLLNQLVNNFQSSGLQNQGASLDPSSFAA